MTRTVLVICRACAGTGNARDSHLQCEYCLGQAHVAVDRTLDDGVPDGETEWCRPTLPDFDPEPSPRPPRTDAPTAKENPRT